MGCLHSFSFCFFTNNRQIPINQPYAIFTWRSSSKKIHLFLINNTEQDIRDFSVGTCKWWLDYVLDLIALEKVFTDLPAAQGRGRGIEGNSHIMPIPITILNAVQILNCRINLNIWHRASQGHHSFNLPVKGSYLFIYLFCFVLGKTDQILHCEEVVLRKFNWALLK